MKRYRFRLEQVSRVRRIQEEQARAELLASRQRLLQAGEELGQRLERFENRATPPRQTSGIRFRAERDRDELLAIAVTAARLAEANARLVVGHRSDEWAEAARELSTLDRLDARAREEHALEVARDEQKVLDDLVMSRWSNRPGEESP